MPKLIVNPGTDQAWEIPLSPGTTMLGSDPARASPINHESVSPAHCEINLAENVITIKDLGSAYGTFVNHAPITEAPLTPGEIITLGNVDLQFVSDGAPGAAAAGDIPIPPPMPMPPETRSTTVVPVVDARCKFHPASPAAWTCHKCRTYFCELCVTPRRTEVATLHFCRRCGSECAPVRFQVEQSVEKVFFQLLPSAFKYALTGNGVILLVAGAVFFSLLEFIGSHAAIGPYGGIVPALVGLFVTGYVFNYSKRIITSTVNGDATPPDWPDFGNWQEDIAAPLWQLLTLYVLCFGPATIMRWWHPLGEAHAGMITLAVAAMGALLAPMGMLALAMFDSIGALNPIALVWSIARIPLHYLIAAAMFELVLAANLVVSGWLSSVSRIPIVPGLLSGFVSLYLLVTGMRILGLLYVSKQKELGWFSNSPGRLSQLRSNEPVFEIVKPTQA